MTAALDRATALHAEPQFQAFFHVIGAGESNETLSEDAYRAITLEVGGKLTEWAHPWYGQKTSTVGHSTACGAFGFLGTSWKECSDALGLGNDFSPLNQRLAAIWTIDVKRHATAQVLAGDMAGAIAKLRDEWVSLPGLTIKRAYEIFRRWGGVTQGEPVEVPTEASSQPAAPIPATPTPTGGTMDPLSLVTLLTSLFAPKLKAKLDGVLGTDTGTPLVNGLLQMAQQLTSKADPLEAVAVARQDPAVVAKLEAKTEDWFAQVSPALDKLAAYDKQGWDAEEASRTAAADRGAAMQAQGPLSGNPQFLIATGILTMVGVVVMSVLWKDAVMAIFLGKEGMQFGFSTDMQAFVIGAIVGAALTAVIGYFFGSTRQSAAKDITIDAIARQSAKK